MKSAYELALERIEKQGIERPREGALDDATRERMAEVRSKAQAELAQLEIMHRDRAVDPADLEGAGKAEEEYLLERRRIEEHRERELEKLRGD
jgi:hypothetical protein